jgi:hypothetical protein
VVGGSGVAQGVAQQHVPASGEAEHDLDTLLHEGPSHCLGDEHRRGTLPILRSPLPSAPEAVASPPDRLLVVYDGRIIAGTPR